MAQHIARCLAWVRALLTLRSPGRHRASSGTSPLRTTRTVTVRPWHPPYFSPIPRRDFEEPIDGLEKPIFDDASALVRPYVVAAEQWKRQRTLLLATSGADGQEPYLTHGVEVAR
jgi:hypothetical protein